MDRLLLNPTVAGDHDEFVGHSLNPRLGSSSVMVAGDLQEEEADSHRWLLLQCHLRQSLSGWLSTEPVCPSLESRHVDPVGPSS